MVEEPKSDWNPEEEELLDSTVPQDAVPMAAKVLNVLIVSGAFLLVGGFAVSVMSPGHTRGATRSRQLEMDRRQETLQQAKREADGHGTLDVESTVEP